MLHHISESEIVRLSDKSYEYNRMKTRLFKNLGVNFQSIFYQKTGSFVHFLNFEKRVIFQIPKKGLRRIEDLVFNTAQNEFSDFPLFKNPSTVFNLVV